MTSRVRPLAPRRAFLRRIGRGFVLSLGVIGLSLGIGVAGYHLVAGLGWIDSILNASMILAGMGPVDAMRTPGTKLFASGYALFSGVAFLTSVGVMFAPLAHRFLHRFHLEVSDAPGE
jgi:hypothetical protein